MAQRDVVECFLCVGQVPESRFVSEHEPAGDAVESRLVAEHRATVHDRQFVWNRTNGDVSFSSRDLHFTNRSQIAFNLTRQAASRMDTIAR